MTMNFNQLFSIPLKYWIIIALFFAIVVALLIFAWRNNPYYLIISALTTAIGTVGIYVPIARTPCAVILELMAMVLFTLFFDVGKRKSYKLKKPSDIKIMFCYFIPTVAIYILFYTFYAVLLPQEPNSGGFVNTLQNIHLTVSLGFLINAIFKYFDRPNPHDLPIKLTLKQGSKTFIYELKEVIQDDKTNL